MPPSHNNALPLIPLAASLVKNKQAFAISIGG